MKFQQLKTSNGQRFEKKNKETEEKRLLKLKLLDDSIYGTLGEV
jgi:hypothetical protein